MKQCSVCHQEKELTEYGINKALKNGRMNRCKQCNKEIATKNYEKNYGSKYQREQAQTQLYNLITNLRSQGQQLKDIAETTGLDKSSISYYLNKKRKVGMNAVRKYMHKQYLMDEHG